MKTESMYGWVFTFNIYSEKWLATTRDHYDELWSGNKGYVISSSSIKTLESLILKAGGDINKIHSFVK